MSKHSHTPASAAAAIEEAHSKTRWSLEAFSPSISLAARRCASLDLDRAIASISQKMLTQRLRRVKGDGIVTRTVHAEVPPKVEYHLTPWGQSHLSGAGRTLTWAEQQPAPI